jgi:acyl-homoserine lactone acylase PvdQ
MGKARTLDEFRTALARTALSGRNTMYADRDGHIMYVHGNAVQRRSAGVDMTRPLDGGDPATAWQGYHDLADLPLVIDPPSGWIQSAGASPFAATAEGENPDASNHPPYMAPEPDNARARNARRILAGEGAWTLDGFAAAAFDTRLADTDADVRAIIDEWERLGAYEPDRATKLDVAIDELRAWDGVSTVESSATTLFVLWKDRMRIGAAPDDRWARLAALEAVIARLQSDWGRDTVAWGEMNRLQRPRPGGGDSFDDAAPSLPIPGAPAWSGSIFAFDTRPAPSGRIRYGVSGATWVSVVDFAPDPRARAVVPTGQSGVAGSPHAFDQAPLYARGRLRDAWFRREDVDAHATATYHPGGR